MLKLLLDTDIGSDIDDAMCLAYLLSQPRCELLGVTTVSGDVEARARLVSEEPGESPLAWQGGKLSRAIEEFCGQDEVRDRLEG